MNRRNFIRLSTMSAAAGIIAPSTVLAGSSKIMTSGAAGGIFYTKDAPGRWSKKIGGHLPHIETSGNKIEVITKHSMSDYEHYIVKHMILDKDFNFLDEKMFKPGKGIAAISSHEFKNYRGQIHVLSVCNKHDTWLNIAEV